MIKRILHFLYRYLTDKNYRFLFNASKGVYNNMPDKEYLERLFYAQFGKELNLENPVTFNEKMQWLKLYNRNPLHTKMVDKYSVRDYLKEKVGEEYIVPVLGAWENADDIDFNALPEQFVLKTTHGCGGMYICRDRSKFDIKKAKKGLNKALKRRYFYHVREWPYKDVVPRIICEPYLQDGNTENLNVYKVFNFSGKPYLIQTIQNDKTSFESIDYFDTDWNVLDLHQNYPNSKNPLPKPKTLEKMLELSAKCSEGFPFCVPTGTKLTERFIFRNLHSFPMRVWNPIIPKVGTKS